MGIDVFPEQLPPTQDIADPLRSAEHRGEGLSEDALPVEPDTVRPHQTTLDTDDVSFQEESDDEWQQQGFAEEDTVDTVNPIPRGEGSDTHHSDMVSSHNTLGTVDTGEDTLLTQDSVEAEHSTAAQG